MGLATQQFYLAALSGREVVVAILTEGWKFSEWTGDWRGFRPSLGLKEAAVWTVLRRRALPTRVAAVTTLHITLNCNKETTLWIEESDLFYSLNVYGDNLGDLIAEYWKL